MLLEQLRHLHRLHQGRNPHSSLRNRYSRCTARILRPQTAVYYAVRHITYTCVLDFYTWTSSNEQMWHENIVCASIASVETTTLDLVRLDAAESVRVSTTLCPTSKNRLSARRIARNHSHKHLLLRHNVRNLLHPLSHWSTYRTTPSAHSLGQKLIPIDT